MDSEDDLVKKQLIYQYNLVHSIIPNFEEKFKQQLVSKLIGRFLDECNNSRIELPNSLDKDVEVVVKREGKKIKAIIDTKNGDEFNLNWCYSCRNVLIPGINLRIRIKYEKGTKKSKKRKEGTGRCVEYECLLCFTKMRFLDSLVQRDSNKEDRINDKIMKDAKDKIRGNALNMEEIRSRKRRLECDNKNRSEDMNNNDDNDNENSGDINNRNDISKRSQKTQTRKKNKRKKSELSGLLERKRQEEANQEVGMSLFDFMK